MWCSNHTSRNQGILLFGSWIHGVQMNPCTSYHLPPQPCYFSFYQIQISVVDDTGILGYWDTHNIIIHYTICWLWSFPLWILCSNSSIHCELEFGWQAFVQRTTALATCQHTCLPSPPDSATDLVWHHHLSAHQVWIVSQPTPVSTPGPGW